MSESDKFVSFSSRELTGVDVKVYRKRRSVHLLLPDGRKVVLKGRGLKQLLSHAGVGVREFFRMDDEERRRVVLGALQGKELILDAVAIDDGVFYVYRTVTPQYTPIPHRVLFDYVATYLRERYGVGVEPVVVRYERRTVAYFPLLRLGVNTPSGEEIVAGVAVSNANTGKSSVRVYPFVGGYRYDFISIDVRGRSVRAYHVKAAEGILDRVGRAVDRVVEWLNRNVDSLTRMFRALRAPMSRDEIAEWLRRVERILPAKYRDWFERVMRRASEREGNTRYSMWSAVAYMAKAMEGKNENAARGLYRLLEEFTISVTEEGEGRTEEVNDY